MKGRLKDPNFWEAWDDEELLSLRISDLNLKIQGSPIDMQIQRVFRELEAKGLRFKPHFWISDEWFSPDGVPGVALPFYLLHPRLISLEKKFMGYVEGLETQEALMIIRHEIGHAFDNAFKLRQSPERQRLFGPSRKRYPTSYLHSRFSKAFVQHLSSGYAQAHPDEDFAETFAVWLSPSSRWRSRYQGWPAMEKLLFMDDLMKSIRGRRALNSFRGTLAPMNRLQMTLGDYYRDKLKRFGLSRDRTLDTELFAIFGPAEGPKSLGRMDSRRADRFLMALRSELKSKVAQNLGEPAYRVDKVIRSIVERAESLDLNLKYSEGLTKKMLLDLVALQSLRFLETGKHRVVL